MAIEVSWIPGHPTYGSISMLRYWALLAQECRPTDPFRCRAVIAKPPLEALQDGGRWRRHLARRVSYPLRVRKECRGAIAHVLDHSWADMLGHVSKRTKLVVTVHDLIPLRFPGELSPAQTKRFEQWVSCVPQADAIVAVSEYTKAEIIDLLGVSPEKISVVQNGVKPPAPRAAAAGGFPQLPVDSGRYFIGSIGSTQQRKNLDLLPDALAMFGRRSSRKPVLVRAGALLPTPLRERLRTELGRDCLIELGRLANDELDEFYRAMDVVVVPSMYEGFGLPVVEAMASAVPVVAARSSSLPEVGGEAARYFAPEDPEGLAHCLLELSEDDDFAAEVGRAGWKRSKMFDWRSTLEGYFTIYQDLLA